MYACYLYVHVIADENPISSDASSIDNMLAEEGSVNIDTSTSNALK